MRGNSSRHGSQQEAQKLRLFFQAEDGIRDKLVTGVQTCALPISALHKSMRESDPDATIYWLVRMLEAGEEPLYLARRIVRFASEDIGLADPRALRVAIDAKEAFE